MARLTDAQEKAFQALARSYRAELPSKVRAIVEAAAALERSGWDYERARELYDLVHRLTGSAAIYGFQGISRAAEGLEAVLKSAIDLAAIANLTAIANVAEQVPQHVHLLASTPLNRRGRSPGQKRAP